MNGIVSQLTERVTIQQAVATADAFGGRSITWSTLASVFAHVQPVKQTTRERSLADQANALAAYRVRMRYRSDVNASMRLQWRQHQLQIHTLHEADGMLELLTYEEHV